MDQTLRMAVHCTFCRFLPDPEPAVVASLSTSDGGPALRQLKPALWADKPAMLSLRWRWSFQVWRGAAGRHRNGYQQQGLAATAF
jgi:hypothetical protein